MTNQSGQVDWWSVHEFVAPYLTAAPMAGTPAWCDLPADDPLKWIALLDAARHWALRVETCQAAACEASRDVAAAYDWAAISVEFHRLTGFYAEKPWMRRTSA